MPPEDTLFVIQQRDDRMAQINAMEIGDTVCVARRLDTGFGIPEDAIKDNITQMRGVLDQQAIRARRRLPGKQFTVENGSFITRGGAIMLCAVLTRTE